MNKLLSLIVPVFNEEEVLPVSYARMSAAMQAVMKSPRRTKRSGAGRWYGSR